VSILGGWVTNPNGWNCVSGGVVPGADLLIGTLINEAFGHPVPFLTTAARLNLGFRWALLLDYLCSFVSACRPENPEPGEEELGDPAEPVVKSCNQVGWKELRHEHHSRTSAAGRAALSCGT
jgi:hypothetical protein